MSCPRPFRLSCIVRAMEADDRNKRQQQTSGRKTIRSVYSKDGDKSVRGQIRKLRAEIDKKNQSDQHGEKKRDPYAYDETEEGFLAALGMDKKIPKHEEITRKMVGWPSTAGGYQTRHDSLLQEPDESSSYVC